jgi:hypothetical protein
MQKKKTTLKKMISCLYFMHTCLYLFFLLLIDIYHPYFLTPKFFLLAQTELYFLKQFTVHTLKPILVELRISVRY